MIWTSSILPAAAVRQSSLTRASVFVGTVATHPRGAARRKLRLTGARLEQRQAPACLGQCVLPTGKAKVVAHELVASPEARVVNDKSADVGPNQRRFERQPVDPVAPLEGQPVTFDHLPRVRAPDDRRDCSVRPDNPANGLEGDARPLVSPRLRVPYRFCKGAEE